MNPIVEHALAEIKKECARHSDCYKPEKCPFVGDGEGCTLQVPPHAYKITEEDKK